jgi:hypothetical protein
MCVLLCKSQYRKTLNEPDETATLVLYQLASIETIKRNEHVPPCSAWGTYAALLVRRWSETRQRTFHLQE